MESGGSSESPNEESPAEFFEGYKNIAGFDNPGKSLYTTMTVLVEHALDSVESIPKLPSVEITIKEIGTDEISFVGPQLDNTLYRDPETPKASKKRRTKKLRVQETQAENTEVKEPTSAKAKGRGGASIYEVTCKDNGEGMPHDDILNMFGQVSSGTKHVLKQTREKFGLAAKMVLIWSKMSTGQEMEILSSIEGQDISCCCLDIDIHQTRNSVTSSIEIRGKENWQGTAIRVFIMGNWTAYKNEILQYMRQMAVITPYAQFNFKFISDTETNVTKSFARRTESIPTVPSETKYHPSAVDILLLKRLIDETSKSNLLEFLQHEFVNIKEDVATKLIEKMGLENTSDIAVKTLTRAQIYELCQLFHLRFFGDLFGDPSCVCLSPAYEYNLRLGIEKELKPEMVATHTSRPATGTHVFEGHPFIVEVGVSLGGKSLKQGLNIFRFANRVPLLFVERADVVFNTAMNKIKWDNYNINHTQEKIGVFVSIVSTKIPFKGTRKEYIGDDITEIASVVKRSIKRCCKQLEHKIKKKIEADSQRERKKIISELVGPAAEAMYKVSKEAIKSCDERHKHFEDDPAKVIEDVSSEAITGETLMEDLVYHVNELFATKCGVDEELREDRKLGPPLPEAKFTNHSSSNFTFSLLNQV